MTRRRARALRPRRAIAPIDPSRVRTVPLARRPSKVLAAEIRRGVMSVSGRVDLTYRRPSRRASASRDIVLPALQQPVPEVAVVCGTSGSQ